MIAKELISSGVLPLRTSDKGEDALQVMSDFHVRHLPIVNDTQLLGIISEDDIYAHDTALPIGGYQLSIVKTAVRTSDHIFEIMSLMAEYELTSVAVVDEDNSYVGIILLEDILHFYASSYSFKEPGAIIVLQMSKFDYSLSEISRIIEMEQGSILSTFISNVVNSNNILVTLKINQQEIGNIIATLERFDYKVQATYTESTYLDTLKERYDLLMNYLQV